MNQLIEINSSEDILSAYQNTPISLLIEYHNLNKTFDDYTEAELLVGMCMDHRKHLHIPDNFSYIIRTGGANLRYSEFKVSYAISVGGIKHIALIGHNNCGMVNLVSKKGQFIDGLVNNGGWSKERAEEHFNNFAPMFEIGNAAEFVTLEANRLRNKYPNVVVAPLFYNVDNNKLYMIEE
ncbi:carbonic anhydrase [Marinifilum fragile]|uniref:carbonic anhydrase n=1 Tax=Marinifilum fragile TaxID=570161 RepID=UPI002AA6C980|nr:carbonic anhydrase [Marinifilum fragile]